MTVLTDILNVTISRETASVQRTSFSIPCFIAAHTAFSGRAKEYSSTTEVAVDFATTSNVYKASQKYFAQGQGLSKIVVGRRQVPSVELTPTVANNTTYSFTLQGKSVTFTSDGSASAANIVTGLKAAIVSAGVTGITTSSTNTLIITPTVAGAGYGLKNISANLSAANAAVTETWAETIAAVRGTNNTWYAMSTESHLDADVLAIAAEIETLEKAYITSSQASAIKTNVTNDQFSQLKALGYDNTRYIWNATADTTFPECAWVGYYAPKRPGSTNWCYKTLSGVVADTLTSSEANYIKGKNGSTYESIGGQSVVVGGKVASGEWGDVMDFVYWLTARIREGLWNQQINTDKIAFTPAGAAIYEGEIRSALAEGIAVGGISASPAPTVTVPNVLNLSSATRATRTLSGIKFTAQLAGAILYATINGTVAA